MNKLNPVLIAVALAAGVAGCGGEDLLSKSVVTSIPPGNASGNAYSGTYNLTLTTTSCSGECPVILIFVTCKEGSKVSTTARVVQDGGKLDIDVSGNTYLNDLKGGINSDGTYQAGGYGTQNSGSVAVTARVDGKILGDGTITGTARARGNGSVDTYNIACTATYDLAGKKK